MKTIRHLRVLSVSAGCVGIFLLVACSGSSSQRTILNYVPSSSYAVLAVNWKTVKNDPELKKISKGANIEKLFTQLGVDGDAINEFAVFGEPGASATGSAGLIAKGNFKSVEIIKELKTRGWTEQEFEGQRVYVNPEDSSWLTTLDKSHFVLGTESGVKDAVGAKAKPANRFTSNSAYKTLSASFEGKQYPILMMIALPQASEDVAHAAVELTSTVMDLSRCWPIG